MKGNIAGATVAAQVDAAKWLGTYIFGKPVETSVQLSMTQHSDHLPNLTDDELEELLRGGRLSPELRGPDDVPTVEGGERLEPRVLDVHEVRPVLVQRDGRKEGADGSADSSLDDGPHDGDPIPDEPTEN